MPSRRFRLLFLGLTVAAAVAWASAGSLISFRTVASPGACGAGNAGEMIIDTSDSSTPKYCDGSTWRALGVGGLMNGWPEYTTGRKASSLWCAAANNPYSGTAPPATFIAGTGTVNDNTVTAAYRCSKYVTTATDGGETGHIDNANWALLSHQPIFKGRFFTSTDITFMRMYVGLYATGSTPPGVVASPTAESVIYAALVYDSAAATPNWYCCSGDGTTHSCADTGVAVTASTGYVLTVDWSTAAQLVCRVDSTTIIKTTNLSAVATTGLARRRSIKNFKGTAHTFYMSHNSSEMN